MTLKIRAWRGSSLQPVYGESCSGRLASRLDSPPISKSSRRTASSSHERATRSISVADSGRTRRSSPFARSTASFTSAIDWPIPPTGGVDRIRNVTCSDQPLNRLVWAPVGVCTVTCSDPAAGRLRLGASVVGRNAGRSKTAAGRRLSAASAVGRNAGRSLRRRRKDPGARCPPSGRITHLTAPESGGR